MIQATCPHCAFQAGIEAFFVDAEGKRLAAVMAELPPDCGRAVLGYLGLFKPAKTALRTARATKLAGEVLRLVQAGSVCRDERGGVRRAATPAMWAQGMETMLAQRDALTLPMESHSYLRAVVFGIADKADAVAERERETQAKEGRHLKAGAAAVPAPVESKLANALAFIEQRARLEDLPADEVARLKADARAKHGGER